MKKLSQSIQKKSGLMFVAKVIENFLTADQLEQMARTLTGYEGNFRRVVCDSDEIYTMQSFDEVRRFYVSMHQIQRKGYIELRFMLGSMMIHTNDVGENYLISLKDKFFNL